MTETDASIDDGGRQSSEPRLQTNTEPELTGGDGEQNDVAKCPSFESLDPSAVKLWRLEGASSGAFLGLGAVIGGISIWFTEPSLLWTIPLGVLAAGTYSFISTIWLPPRKYQAWGYRLDGRVLELRHGVFWQTAVMIPLNRIQHVDLSRGPLERLYGVATVEVHTAGTKSASHKIPCLQVDVGLQLRSRLVAAARIKPG